MRVNYMDNIGYRVMACLALALVVMMPEVAMAGTSLEDLGGGLMCKIVKALTGKAGRAIATIGIVILGISAFFGKVNWGLAILVAIGVLAIFAAAAIVGALGDGPDLTCP